eukprot:2460256-Pyramimonas_sp.AAC.1
MVFWDGTSHHTPADERRHAEDATRSVCREQGNTPDLPLLTAQANRAVFRTRPLSSEVPLPARAVPGAPSRLRIITDFLASRNVMPGTPIYRSMLSSERTYVLARDWYNSQLHEELTVTGPQSQ